MDSRVLRVAISGSLVGWLVACAAPPPAAPGPASSASSTSSVQAPASASPVASVPAPAASASAPIAPAAPTPLVGGLPSLKLDASVAHCNSVSGKPSPDCAPTTWIPKGFSVDPDAPAALWDVEIAEGSTYQPPYGAGVEVYGVIVRGMSTLRVWPKQAAVMSAWTGFRLPAGGGAIEGPAHLVVAVVTTDHSPLAKLPPPSKSPSNKRPYDVFSFEREAALSWGKGAYEARIAVEARPEKTAFECKQAPAAQGCPGPASLTLLRMSKNAPVAEHVHDKEWELLFVLSGSGTMQRRRGNGAPEPAPVHQLSPVAVKPGLFHAWTPDDTSEFIAVQLYVGPGPEQRFHKLATP